MPSIRTLIVEDHVDFRAFLRSKLQEATQCVIVGECTDGLEAVERAKELQPDLILLDLALPQLNGMEAARRIRKISPNSKIVFLSQDHSPEVAQAAFHLGAAGYLLKSDANELPLVVDAVLQGKIYVSNRVRKD